MKVSPIQNSFNAGEFTPLLMGRTDFDAYKNALKTCLNHIPYVQGGITRRPATYFCDETKDSSKTSHLIPFKFSTTQAYIIELGDLYARFKRNNAPVTETALVITGITAANPGVLTYTGTDPSNGDHIDLAAIVGMTELNGRRVTVANVNAGANTFELSGINTTAYAAYVSGGTASKVYTLTTPYAEANVSSVVFTQSADVMYLTHPSYAPRKLSRTGHTSWTLTAITFLDGPYLPINSGATTITPSATTGIGITLTASAAVFTLVTDVGRLVRIKHGSTWGYATITAVASTTSATATVVNAFGATTASVSWRLGKYSDTTGYPTCVTFFEDRLCFGGATATPQGVDGSKTGDYENFAPTDTAGVVAADHAVSVTLNSEDVQAIRWLKGEERGLLAGTYEGEWVVTASTQGGALSPTNISAKQATSHGSKSAHQPVRAGKAVLFVQRSGRKLREMAYLYEVDGFRSPDLTILSEHITRGGITDIAFQQDPQPIVWGARADGTLLGLTYERDQKVTGWHRHELGGYSNAGHTAIPVVESISVIPSADGTRDELWMIVKRYINGGTKRYCEYLTKLWEQDDVQADASYVDCGMTYSGASTLTGTGAHHLAGETVSVLVDGATHPDITITATGGWTITRAATKVQLGYSYNSDGQMLRPDAGAADGTSQGKTQRINRVTFRLLDSLGIQVGPDFTNLTRPTTRTSSDPAGSVAPLFTGDLGVTWEGDYSSSNYICWRWDQPLPGTILAVMPQLQTQDR